MNERGQEGKKQGWRRWRSALSRLIGMLGLVLASSAVALDPATMQRCLTTRDHPQFCEDLIANDVRNNTRDSRSRPCLSASSDYSECNKLIVSAIEDFRAKLKERQQREESARRAQAEQRAQAAAQAPPPHSVPVIAKGAGVVPGAVVCTDYRTVNFVIELYKAAWRDQLEDTITKGQSRLIRGASAPEPDPKRYGCVLLNPGTPMELEQGNAVPVVVAKTSDGKTIRGVTSPGMYANR